MMHVQRIITWCCAVRVSNGVTCLFGSPENGVCEQMHVRGDLCVVGYCRFDWALLIVLLHTCGLTKTYITCNEPSL